jgi:DNA polymerase III delta prime subunit
LFLDGRWWLGWGIVGFVEQIPILWLCGPPGVGKTAVAWEMYGRFVRLGIAGGLRGRRSAGHLLSRAGWRPDRHELKAGNVAALRASLAAAGARLMIVSGVVDAARGP